MAIDSELGRGTRIGLFLPLHSGPVVEARQPGVRKRAPAGAGSILLVDDDHEVRQAVTYMLDFLGYSVLQAANGIEAIEIFTRQRQSVDLVLLDVLMPPRMDGSEAFRALKALKPDLRCLLISGFAPDEVVKECIEQERARRAAQALHPDPGCAQAVARVMEGDCGRLGRERRLRPYFDCGSGMPLLARWLADERPNGQILPFGRWSGFDSVGGAVEIFAADLAAPIVFAHRPARRAPAPGSGLPAASYRLPDYRHPASGQRPFPI